MKTLSQSLLMPIGVVVGSLLTVAVVVGQEELVATEIVSPNGLFTLTVADEGITLAGPNATLVLGVDSIDIQTINNATVNIDGNAGVTVNSNAGLVVTSNQDSAITSN